MGIDFKINIELGGKQSIFKICINFEKYVGLFSLGDALASSDKKNSKISSKKSNLRLLCLLPDSNIKVLALLPNKLNL
jgi:hypothetical protein